MQLLSSHRHRPERGEAAAAVAAAPAAVAAADALVNDDFTLPSPLFPSSALSHHHQNNYEEDSGRQDFAALALSSPTSSTATAASAATTAFLRERHGWFRQPPHRDLTLIPLTPGSREERGKGEKE